MIGLTLGINFRLPKSRHEYMKNLLLFNSCNLEIDLHVANLFRKVLGTKNTLKIISLKVGEYSRYLDLFSCRKIDTVNIFFYLVLLYKRLLELCFAWYPRVLKVFLM